MKNFNDLMIHGIKICDEQKNTVKTHRTLGYFDKIYSFNRS